jgi:hypothetical protein
LKTLDQLAPLQPRRTAIAPDAGSYRSFLEGKIKLASFDGVEIDAAEINPVLKPHQRDIVVWALTGGRRAIFAAFGLGKTLMQLEILRLVRKHAGGMTLIVLPLGVRQEFFRDAELLGLTLKFIRYDREADAGVDVHVTNYESVLDGKVTPQAFTAASLDEAAVLRSYGSKTYQTFLPLFADVRFRFVATATPSPNRYKELIHYAGFLGIMDTGQALTRFFQRDSTKANELNLYPHKEDEFWLWMHSWAVFVQKPSDLGHADDGYDLPPVHVHWHEVPSDHSTAGTERDGQGALFRNAALGVTQASSEKRDSIAVRVAKMRAIIDAEPGRHAILWHDLESERDAIERAVPESQSVFGSLDLVEREKRIIDFSDGKFAFLATKPELSGSGCNFQRHCSKAIFVGVGFKFHDFIQAVHRIVRFLQVEACDIHIIHSEAEREVVATLKKKWAEHERLTARMSELIRRYGLGQHGVHDQLKRAIGVERVAAEGEHYLVARNDAVAEAKLCATNSVGQIVTSIPFANHYEYTAQYEDFGHTDDNGHFWAQMDFLTPELLRILQPGRLACIHVKDRVQFGNVTGAGLPTISPFHAEAIFHYRRHGFDYVGMITVVTDVVRENNQTYRLGYSEMCKDASKIGVGSPEYVLLFHKPQSDRSRGYADTPVVKSKTDYSLARWQINAHAFWRSSGDRQLTPAEMMTYPPDVLAKVFTAWSLEGLYNFEDHVAIGEALEKRNALPSSFMSLAPGSHDPTVWHDVNRMRTLNGEQVKRNVEMHLCPLQFDIVDRLIRQYSNEGDLVYDPFGGLMTVPYRALLLKRRGGASELNESYFRDGLHYLEAAERQRGMPGLFDLERAAEAAPPQAAGEAPARSCEGARVTIGTQQEAAE